MSLKFAKLVLKKPKNSWENVLWTNKTKILISGHNTRYHTGLKPLHISLNTSTVKHDGEGVMVWAGFADTRHLTIIKSAMHSSVQCRSDEKHLNKGKCLSYSASYSRQTSKSTAEWLKNNPDLSLTEILCHNLGLWINEHPQTSMNWINIIEWVKFLLYVKGPKTPMLTSTCYWRKKKFYESLYYVYIISQTVLLHFVLVIVK